jgi:glutamate dehydrogenase
VDDEQGHGQSAGGSDDARWSQALLVALERRFDAGLASRLAATYEPRLPPGYREAVAPVEAAANIAVLRTLEGRTGEIVARFDAPPTAAGRPAGVRCQIYSGGSRVELSRMVPILECLGFWVVDELPWSLVEGTLHVHDFAVRTSGGFGVDLGADAGRLADAVLALWSGRADVDSLNRLVLRADLSVEEVALLRAYRRYRTQVDGRYSPQYVDEVLVAHPAVARSLVSYFAARFAPSVDEDVVTALHSEALGGIDGTARLDHDRILRGLLGTIEATVRTNRHLRPEGPLALKLDAERVPGLPAPVPRHEIFVDGPRVEGVHLRFGDVARGGIRWSDRPEDYRSEVLDLARTQVVKNSLIVPTGSKGGFIVRKLPEGDPAAVSAAVRAAYEDFIGGLLDLTDDLRHGEVVPVPRRRDGNDPYLVVAADKGTAALSDVANGLSLKRGYWLGDAFASGGSHGYDHKALGVTARGAWVAVQRHFRSLGVDVQSEPFTVAGVGDMSGDVFGNGLLRSKTARLVAAFDHRDIFCDPDPDALAAFEERRRLFELPRSSWQQYDRALISEGGGVWSRQEKRIELHPALRALVRLDAEEVTPAELIRAILRAPVDLLFAGGIGTFVRATTEDDGDIDDRANSDLRVEAGSLRARVVGEGANLSFTQRARIEYARRGGRINMDAVDNSAGVDTSDHEVNLKILLALAVEEGEIDEAERNRLLAEQTELVVAAVLDDVGRQCDTLSRAQLDSADDLGAYTSLLDGLEREKHVDRVVDCLPGPEELSQRREAGAGLTRPELAVLAAGAKRQLRAALAQSSLPDQPALRETLADYFPAALAQRFDHLLERHRLRRELVSTMLANSIVDRLGVTFAHAIVAETGVPLADVAAAVWVALQVAGRDVLSACLVDAGAPPELAALTLDDPEATVGRVANQLVVNLTRAYLLEASGDPGSLVDRDKPLFQRLWAEDQGADSVGGGPSPHGRRRADLAEAAAREGLPPRAAAAVVRLSDLEVVPTAARLAARLGREPLGVAIGFIQLTQQLGLAWYRSRLNEVKPAGRWGHAARRGLLADLDRLLEDLTAAALRAEPTVEPGEAVERWMATHQAGLADAARVRDEVAADRGAGLDAMAVAIRALFAAADDG